MNAGEMIIKPNRQSCQQTEGVFELMEKRKLQLYGHLLKIDKHMSRKEKKELK